MASFVPTVAPTSDPNWTNASKEPSRIAPLEQVSIPVNNTANKSAGVALQGISSLFDTAVSLEDASIKRDIKEQAYNLIDPIRNASGADMSSDDVTAIAGTGAKGRARMASAEQQNLFGSPDGGAGSSSYAPEDAGRDYGQLPSIITGGTPKTLPPAANIELSRVSRMNQAYMQGELSDSYYNAQLVSVAKELRARYPGYRDEVDATISGITGINPANALRKSLISDLNANAAARMQAGSEQEKQIYQNRETVTAAVPDFFTNRQKYVGQEQQVLAQAYQIQSQRAQVTADQARLSYDSSNAAGVAASMADFRVRTAVNAMNNMNDPDGKSVQKRFEALMNTPGGATPEQIQQMVGTLQTIKTQVTQGISADFASPIQGGKSINGYMGNDAGKVKGIIENATAPIDAMITAVSNGDYRRAKVMADTLTMTQNTEAMRQINSSSAIKFLSGLSKAGGDAVTGVILQQSDLLPRINKDLANGKLIETMSADQSNPVKGISTQVDEMNKAGVAVNGATLRGLVEGNRQMIMNPNVSKEINANGVRNLFDQKFFANINENERMKTFNLLGSPEMTARVAELAKGDPTLMTQYSNWMKYAFQTVYRGGIANAQEGMNDPRFDTTFNPKTMQVEVTPRPGMSNKGMLGNINQVGNAYVQQVNNGLRLMNEVWKAQGANPQEAALSMLADMGVSPGRNPNPATNPIFQKIGNTLHDMFMGPSPDAQPVAPAGKGRLSQDTGATPLHQTIGQAESGGDYNSVFGFKKGNTRDLSGMTVGEIMNMQKYNTDNGQPSSAVGKYQFLRKTLDSLVKEGSLSLDDHFGPDVQDAMATKLMERRGLNDFRSGRISQAQFITNLSQEWAGLPGNNGLSNYAGDGLNAATVSLPTVVASLGQIK